MAKDNEEQGKEVAAVKDVEKGSDEHNRRSDIEAEDADNNSNQQQPENDEISNNEKDDEMVGIQATMESDNENSYDNKDNDDEHMDQVERGQAVATGVAIVDATRDDDTQEAKQQQEEDSAIFVQPEDTHVVVMEDQQTPSPATVGNSSERRRRLHEKLPVATPILDAEVVVWEYPRPTYRKRFGRGFFGRRQGPQDEQQDRPPRDPIFTNEDCSNPFRCLCKLIGILVTFPFYLLYFFFCKCDVWMEPFCICIDYIIFRPLGAYVDCVVYVLENIPWSVYLVVFVPVFTLLVILTRILRNACLYLVKYFLMSVECIFDYTILPVFRLITATIASIYKHALLPCGLGIYAIIIAVLTVITNGVKLTCKTMSAGLLFLHKTIILPCTTSIQAAAQYVCGLVTSVAKTIGGGIQYGCNLITTCVSTICKTFLSGVAYICNVITGIISTICTAISSGITYGWGWVERCILVICKKVSAGIQYVCNLTCKCVSTICKSVGSGINCIYSSIGRCYTWMWEKVMVPAYNGFVGGIRYGYKHILVPIGKCIHALVIQPIISLATGAYNYILVPLAQLIRDVSRAIGIGIVAAGRLIRDVFRAIGNVIAAVGGAIGNVFRSIGASIAAVGRVIGDVFRAIGTSLAGIFRAIGDMMRGIFEKT